MKLFEIPINVIEECMHLTKLSSIKGSKLDSVNIDITPWSNVEKVKGAKSGTIHFKKMKYVKVMNVTYANSNNQSAKQKKPSKKKKKLGNDFKANDDFLDFSDSDSLDDDRSEKKVQKQNVFNKKQWKKRLKALEKTKEVIDVKNVEKYLIDSQKVHQQNIQKKEKKNKKKLKEMQKKERLKKKKEEDLKNYVGVFDQSNMTSNRDLPSDFEDTFM